jgi:hypothetical protein
LYPPEENKSKQLFNAGDILRIEAYKDNFTKVGNQIGQKSYLL